LLIIADNQRGVLRTEEAGGVGGRAEKLVRRNADEVRQFGAGLLQFLGKERAERRVLDRAARDAAGAHLVSGPAVIGLLGGHRANQRHLVHVLGKLGQMFADFDAGHVRVDFLVRTAIFVAGLEVERIHLTGAAVHPEQDAGALAFLVFGGFVGKSAEPAG
jgi:hypothetical protein